MNQAQQLAGQMAHDGEIVLDAQEPEVQNEFESEICVNIREDTLTLFEDNQGQQYLQSADMDEHMYIAPIPTANGFTPELVIEPDFELTETDTAEQSETDAPSQSVEKSVIMD